MSVLFKNDFIGQYIITYADKGRVGRGLIIFQKGQVAENPLVQDFVNNDLATFKVLNDTGKFSYDVALGGYHTPETFYSECTCPDEEELCKHAIAAAFRLDEILSQTTAKTKSGADGEATWKQFKMDEPIITDLVPVKDQAAWMRFTGSKEVKRAQSLNKRGIVRMGAFVRERITFQVVTGHYWNDWDDPGSGNVSFKVAGDKLVSQCTCGAILPVPFCAHKVAAILDMLALRKDWADAKSIEADVNKLLAPYGLTQTHPEVDQYFNIVVSGTSVSINQKTPGLLPVPQMGGNLPVPPKYTPQNREETALTVEKKALHWVFVKDDYQYRARLVAVLAAVSPKTGNLTSVTPAFDKSPGRYLPLVKPHDIQLARLADDVGREIPDYETNRTAEIGKAAETDIRAYKLLQELPAFFIAEQPNGPGGAIKKPDPVALPGYVSLGFRLGLEGNLYALRLGFFYEGKWSALAEVKWFGYTLFMHEGQLFCLAGIEDVMQANFFATQEYSIKALATASFEDFYNGFVAPLSSKYRIDNHLPKSYKVEHRLLEPA